MPSKVLFLEDNLTIQKIVEASIGSMCSLTVAASVSEAEKILVGKPEFNLIILDVLLPDGDGFSFCKKLKGMEHYTDTPVIFLTGQSEIDDRVQGFESGGDDYIVKPLEPKEFIARVKSKLRKKKNQIQTLFRKAGFEADIRAQKIFRIGSEGERTEELALTPIEFRLFVNFLQNEGKIFSRSELVKTVWGPTVHVSDHTVDTHISALRKKIGDSAQYLKSILKKGYSFAIPKAPPAARS